MLRVSHQECTQNATKQRENRYAERERKRGVKGDSQQFVSFCVDNHKTQTNKRRKKNCYEKRRKKYTQLIGKPQMVSPHMRGLLSFRSLPA